MCRCQWLVNTPTDPVGGWAALRVSDGQHCARADAAHPGSERQRHCAQGQDNLRHLVFCVRPAHRRDVGRQPGAGAQCGSERAYNHALVGNSGANLIYESAGMMASLMGFLLESLLIDNDIIGTVQRTIRGIAVDDESISLDTMRKVCLEGPGRYLGSDQTLKLMQKDYLYPTVGDRSSPNQWTEAGMPDIVDRAARKVDTILATHYPRHIPTAVDDAIRAKFPVRLAREAMQPVVPKLVL